MTKFAGVYLHEPLIDAKVIPTCYVAFTITAFDYLFFEYKFFDIGRAKCFVLYIIMQFVIRIC